MLLTKYGITEIEGIESIIKRLTNQLWKLIPMRENSESWEKHLDSIILELTGTNEILIFNPSLFTLLSKLEGLKNKETDFMLYRKTVFESISLLQECGHAITQ